MSNTRRINAALRYGMVFTLVFGQMAPAFAQQTYYRYTLGEGISLQLGSGGEDDGGWTPPPAGGNSDNEPSGELRIEISSSVRARIGVAMNLRLEAQDAQGDVTWDLGGNTEPPGLSFSRADGTFTGTPVTVATTEGFSVRAVDEVGREGFSRRFAIDVQPAPVITVPASLAANDLADFIVTPQVTHVFGSQTWSVEGVLPYGISVDAANGRLSGRPQQGGTFDDIRLKLVDGDGATATSAAFTIQATSSLGISGLPKTYRIRAGKPFSSAQPTTTGSTSPTTWSAVDDLLPEGLSIDTRTGIVSGTPTTVGQVDGIYVRVTQEDGKTAVHGPVTYEIVGDLAATIPDSYSRLGQTVDIRPAADNRIGQVAWSLTGAPLPAGLQFHPSSGRIDGTPSNTGTTEGVELSMLDASDGGRGTSTPFSIHVWNALRALPPGIPQAVVGTPLEIGAPTATGLRGTATWSMVSALPAGLSFDPETLRVTGTPTQHGTFPLHYRVLDSSDSATATTTGTKITVDPAPVPGAIAFVDFPLEFSVRGGGMLTTMTPSVRNAHGAVNYALAGAPAWISVNTANGQLYGIAPSVSTDTTFPALSLTVTDSEGRAATSRDFSVRVRAPGPLEMGIVGPTFRALGDAAFSTGLPPVAGGSGAFDFSLSGTLPTWLSFDAATGSVVGTPTATSPSATGLVLSVTDAATGAAASSNPFDIHVWDGVSYPAISGTAPAYAGRVGQSFSTSAPVVTGIAGHHAFEIASGALPSWAMLDEATGRIYGTPDAVGLSGPYSIRVTESSTSRGALSIPFTISVTGADPISATVNLSYPATSGTPFTMQPGIANAQGAVTWSMASDFPEWASLDNRTGTVSGIPDAVGTVSGLVLRAVDATGATSSTRAFSIAVAAPPPMTLTGMSSTYFGDVSSALSIEPGTVARAIGPLSWSLASGTLPSWATLSSATGRVTGTPNAVATTTGLSLRVTDSTGNSAVGNVFSIDVRPATLRVTSAPVAPVIRAGAPLSSSAPGISGNTAPVTWSLASGNLPPWSSLDQSTGRVSGTSVDAGHWPGVVLRATEDGTGRTALSAPTSFTVTTPNPTATVTANVEARTYNVVSIRPSSGNVIGSPTWRVSSGTKPAWLTLDTATGRLHGTPTAVESVSGLVLSVRDSADGREGSTGTLSINVEDGTPSIAIPESSVFRAGQPFVLAPTTSDVVGPASFAITGGALPSWAGLNQSTGRISGTPTTATTAPALRMTVTDSRGISGHSSDFSITSRPALAATLDQPSIDIRPGAQVLTARPTVTGALADATWSMAGTLPNGVSLDPGSGIVSGTARSVGTHSVTIRVTDPTDGTVATAGSFTIRVVDTPKAAIAAETAARVGMPVSVRATAGDTIGTVTWQVASGSLPAWAELDPATGTVSGVPTAVGTTTSATLSVTDAQGLSATTGSFRFTVTPRIRIDLPSSTTAARVGRGYSYAPVAADGADGAVTWSMTSTLPEWANFDPAMGRVYGTPPETGVFTLAFRATDVAGNTATSATVAGTVSTNPVVSVSDRTTRVNASFSYQPGISGVVGSFSAYQAGTALPSWASHTVNSGRYHGIPDVVGTTSGIRLRVVDSQGVSGTSDPFSITVAPGISVTSPARTDLVRIASNVAVPAASSSGRIGAVSWSLGSGSLPGGAVIDATTGTVTGQVTTAGTYTYRLRATDNHDGAFATGPESTMTVLNSVRVSGVPSEHVGHVNAPFTSSTPTPVNTQGTRTWSLVGTLPSWATLDTATGRISGTPTETGSTPGLRLRVTDSFDNQTGTSSTFSLRMVPELLVTNMGTSYSARFGFPFVQATPVAQSAVGAVTWSLSGGTLPPWAAFDPATGRISGTPDAVGEWTGLSIEATDSLGAKARSVVFDIEAYSEPSVTMPSAQPKLRVGTPATITPTGRGAVGTRIWTIVSGSLPPGMTIDGTSGRITGTPTTPGTYTATVRMTDGFDGKFAEGSLVAGVSDVLEITGLQDEYRVRVGQYLTTGQAGLVGARSAISYSSVGAIPSGMTFSGGNYSGIVSAAQAPSTYTVTLTGTDSYDGAKATKSFTIRTLGTLTASTSSANIRSGQELPGRAAIVGNRLGTVTWTLAAGTLPPGATLDPDTGAITGTLTVATRSEWTGIRLRATDSDGAVALTGYVSITVDGDIGLAGPADGTGVKNTTFSMPALTASNALGNVSWSANGLPPGLSVSGSGTRLMTGTISGTPTAAGHYTVTVTARDTLDNATASHTVAIFVDTVPVVSMASIVAYVGTQVSVTPTLADKGNGTVTWSLTLPNGTNGVSSLPGGLAFDSATGRISGKPNTTTSTTTFNLKAIEARNVGGTTVQVNSNTVAFSISSTLPTLAITMSSVSGTRGAEIVAQEPRVSNAISTAGYYQLLAYSGSTLQYTFNGIAASGTGVSASYFPRGLVFDSTTGRISGTPETPSYGYTFRIRYSESRTVNGSTYTDSVTTGSFNLSIGNWTAPTISMGQVSGTRGFPIDPVTPSNSEHPNKVSGQYQLLAYSGSTLQASFGSIPAAATGTSASYFPRGLLFDSATGTISGTPETVSYGYSFRIRYIETRRTNSVTTTEEVTTPNFSLSIVNWTAPTISMGQVSGIRGEPIVPVTPTNSEHPNKISGQYQLLAYSGSATFQASFGSIPAAGTGTSATYFPRGLMFDSATGKISGTPETASYGYNFRIRYIETRRTNSATTTEEVTTPNFSLYIGNWATPTISMGAVSGIRGSTITEVTPTNSEHANKISGQYQLLVYMGSGYQTAFGSIPAAGTGASASYFPKGLMFDSATGRISGTPETVSYGYSFRIRYIETRKVNSATTTEDVTSTSFSLYIGNWATPTISMGAVSGTRGVPINPVTPVNSEHPNKVSGQYQILVYSGSSLQATFWSIPAAGTGTSASYFPKGLMFDSATGRISGTPGTVSYGYVFRIRYFETRVVNSATTTEDVTSTNFSLYIGN